MAPYNKRMHAGFSISWLKDRVEPCLSSSGQEEPLGCLHFPDSGVIQTDNSFVAFFRPLLPGMFRYI